MQIHNSKSKYLPQDCPFLDYQKTALFYLGIGLLLLLPWLLSSHDHIFSWCKLSQQRSSHEMGISSLRFLSYKDRRQILPRVRILHHTVMQAQGITFTLIVEMQWISHRSCKCFLTNAACSRILAPFQEIVENICTSSFTLSSYLLSLIFFFQAE